MRLLVLLVLVVVVMVGLLLGGAGYWWLRVPAPALPEDRVRELAHSFHHGPPPLHHDHSSDLPNELEGLREGEVDDYSADQPMVGKVVVVTGASSGVGGSLAFTMFKMGATVIVTSRSQEKSDETVAEFKMDFPFSEGKLYSKKLDVSDFHSIREFSSWVTENFQELHILINNAGHFLLTDLLLPVLRSTPHARILQVSSDYQFSVASGEDLNTGGGALMPRAAQVLAHTFRGASDSERERLEKEQTNRRSDAYGLSKVAQIMHAIELQKILDADDDTNLKIFSCTPGITYTGMMPEVKGPGKLLFQRVFYSPEASTYAPLTALFSHDLRGGNEYWANSPTFFSTAIGQYLLPLAHQGNIFTRILLVIGSAFRQQYLYGQLTISPVNSLCEDSTLTEGLYKWSYAAVHKENYSNENQRDFVPDDSPLVDPKDEL